MEAERRPETDMRRRVVVVPIDCLLCERDGAIKSRWNAEARSGGGGGIGKVFLFLTRPA